MLTFLTEEINKLICNYEPTGSKVTGGAGEYSDEDYVVLVKEEKMFHNKLLEEGFKQDKSHERYHGIGDFKSFRFVNYNLIVTTNEEFYKKFCLATKVAKEFKLVKREDRVRLFQAVLYANDSDNLNPAEYHYEPTP